MDWYKGIHFAKLVAAAYYTFEGQPAPTPHYEVLATLYGNDLATDLNPERGKMRVIIGLILQACASGDVVVAFRGTEGIKEWVQDAHFDDTPFVNVPDAGRTEDGFTAMYESITIGNHPGALSVLRGLARIPWKQPVTSLTVCGHSLGGALATLFAVDVATHSTVPFNSPVVYTYASPRTGDADFAAKYGQLISATFRFVDNVDIVPKLPAWFVPGLAYRHVCSEIGMDSLTLIPLRAWLQPNPVCWHILSSYIYLMSLNSGGAKIPAEPDCATENSPREVLAQIEADLSAEKSIRDKFTAAPRRRLGGN